MTLGERIRQLIEGNPDLSIEGVARAADMPGSQLHRILRGETYDPRIRTVSRIARAIGVPLAEVVSGVDELHDGQYTDDQLARLLIDAGRSSGRSIEEMAALLAEADRQRATDDRPRPRLVAEPGAEYSTDHDPDEK